MLTGAQYRTQSIPTRLYLGRLRSLAFPVVDKTPLNLILSAVLPVRYSPALRSAAEQTAAAFGLFPPSK